MNIVSLITVFVGFITILAMTVGIIIETKDDIKAYGIYANLTDIVIDIFLCLISSVFLFIITLACLYAFIILL